MSIVSLRHVSYVTPDGRALFDDLDLAFGREKCGLIGRNGVGKSTLLKLVLGELSPAAGSVCRNGVVRALQQQIHVDPTAAIADVFGVADGLAHLSRALAGEVAADELADVDWTLDDRLSAALDRVGLAGMEMSRPLVTLSGGQRTRAALAALTFDAPDLVLLDEPTNNLDREGRRLVIDVLAQHSGAAIVVSHDRALLQHMDRIVELSSLGARSYGGNWDVYVQRRAEERAAAEQRLTVARRELKQAERKIQVARERKARKDAAGRKLNKQGGDDQMYLDRQEERAENSSRRANRLSDRQRAAAVQTLETAQAQVERIKTPTVDLPSSGLPAGKTVLTFDEVSGGYSRNAPVFRDLCFSIVGPERIAVTGANGSGKSTLLKLALGRLEPLAGRVRRPARAAMLDQQVAILDGAASLLDNFRRLNPEDNDNACRRALARFLFRADAALHPVNDLSGGEVLRAGLACVLGGRAVPELLALDEPTNHLDLDSVAAIEAGLNGYDGALLVVSHDEAFLAAIGIERRIALDR